MGILPRQLVWRGIAFRIGERLLISAGSGRANAPVQHAEERRQALAGDPIQVKYAQPSLYSPVL